MANDINPAELEKQAKKAAPGVNLGQQAQPANLTQGRQQPGQKGKKTAAQKIYPKLAAQDANSGEEA